MAFHDKESSEFSSFMLILALWPNWFQCCVFACTSAGSKLVKVENFLRTSFSSQAREHRGGSFRSSVQGETLILSESSSLYTERRVRVLQTNEESGSGGNQMLEKQAEKTDNLSNQSQNIMFKPDRVLVLHIFQQGMSEWLCTVLKCLWANHSCSTTASRRKWLQPSVHIRKTLLLRDAHHPAWRGSPPLFLGSFCGRLMTSSANQIDPQLC